RYKRLRDENKPFPSLVLIDGGLGQLHAAAQALEELGITNQPLAAIAKKKRSSTSSARKTIPSCLTATRPSCTWRRWCAPNPTASPSPSIAGGARCATANPSCWNSPAPASAPASDCCSTSAAFAPSSRQTPRH